MSLSRNHDPVIKPTDVLVSSLMHKLFSLTKFYTPVVPLHKTIRTRAHDMEIITDKVTIYLSPWGNSLLTYPILLNFVIPFELTTFRKYTYLKDLYWVLTGITQHTTPRLSVCLINFSHKSLLC